MSSCKLLWQTEKLKKSLDSKEVPLTESLSLRASLKPLRDVVQGNPESPRLADDGHLSLDARIERGETLMQSGQRLAKSGKLGEAYEKYCAGLQLLMEALQKERTYNIL